MTPIAHCVFKRTSIFQGRLLPWLLLSKTLLYYCCFFVCLTLGSAYTVYLLKQIWYYRWYPARYLLILKTVKQDRSEATFIFVTGCNFWRMCKLERAKLCPPERKLTTKFYEIVINMTALSAGSIEVWISFFETFLLKKEYWKPCAW